MKSESEDEEARREYLRRRVAPCCPYVIEPVTIYFLATACMSVYVQQYTYSRLSEQVIGNETLHIDLCNVTNKSTNENFQLQDKIQSRSAVWNQYYNVASGVPSILTTLFFGAFSDHFGRKWPLLVPCIGSLVQMLICIAVVVFKLPLVYMVVSMAVSGLGGGLATMLMGLFSSTADGSSKANRTVRVAFIEFLITLFSSLSQLILGVALKYLGFLHTLMIFTGLIAFLVLYVATFVPSQNSAPGRGNKLSIVYFKETFDIYRSNTGGRRGRLGLLLLAFCLLVIPALGHGSADILYIMDRPLCFSNEEIGYFYAVQYIMCALGVVTFSRIFSKTCKIPDSYIAIFGFVFGIMAYAVEALPTKKWQFFLVPLAFIGTQVPFPMIRSMVSKTVGPEHQGAAFANIAVIETTFNMVGGTIIAGVYSLTNSTFRSAVFFLESGMCFLGAAVICLYILYCKKQKKRTTSLSSLLPDTKVY